MTKNNIISDWLDKYGDPKIDKKVEIKLEKMNKEKYNQIIDDVYKEYLTHTILGVENGYDRIEGYMDGCLVEFDGEYEHFSNPSFQYGYRPHTKEEFISKCKTDSEFSEKWGLKIDEKELSLEDRVRLIMDTSEYRNYTEEQWKVYINTTSAPTKQITLEYNGTKIEVYE